MPGKPLQGLSRREREVVSGTSRRGMIASLVALRRPDVVQRVISLSGSYYWKPADEPQYVGCRLDMPGSGARPFVSTWPQASSRHSSTGQSRTLSGWHQSPLPGCTPRPRLRAHIRRIQWSAQ